MTIAPRDEVSEEGLGLTTCCPVANDNSRTPSMDKRKRRRMMKIRKGLNSNSTVRYTVFNSNSEQTQAVVPIFHHEVAQFICFSLLV